MKASTLFSMVKADLGTLSSYRPLIEQKLQDNSDLGSIGSAMTRYNYANFVEILDKDGIERDFEIDDHRLKDFQRRIDNYLGLYAPGDADLKKYITGISTYLAFIVRRPLHPSGIKFSNDATVYEKDGSFCCSGKRTFIKEDQSFCKYCVCKPAPILKK